MPFNRLDPEGTQPIRDPWTGVKARPYDFTYQTTTKPEDLHEHGRREYGEAHLITGQWIQDNLLFLARMGPMVFDVIMLKHKLDRLLADPARPDHLDDIVGYAKLARSLQETQPQQPPMYPEGRPGTAADYILNCERTGVQPDMTFLEQFTHSNMRIVE